MNEQTAKRVVVAAWEADGGCYICAQSVLDKMAEFEPAIDWERLNSEFREVAFRPEELQVWLAS